jgi:Zn-dependent peptidase ImmA (M78 family)
VENLINTIAHELAHAIIETTRFDYHHDDDTKRLNTK